MVATILPAESQSTPQPLEKGLIGQNSTFSKHGHVVYQIKLNHECINMAASVLLADSSPTLGWEQKVKIQLFSALTDICFLI